jgi:hypothetical protein
MSNDDRKVRVPKALYADDSVCGEFLVSFLLYVIFYNIDFNHLFAGKSMEDWTELINCFLFVCDAKEQVDVFWLACNCFRGDTTSDEFLCNLYWNAIFPNITLNAFSPFFASKMNRSSDKMN